MNARVRNYSIISGNSSAPIGISGISLHCPVISIKGILPISNSEEIVPVTYDADGLQPGGLLTEDSETAKSQKDAEDQSYHSHFQSYLI
jgi:hypothetical protein